MLDNIPPYKLYHPGTIAAATAMGSPLAGAIIMALNYRRLGQPKAAWCTIMIGIILTILVIALGLTVFKSIPRQFIILTEGLGAYFICKVLQGQAFEQHMKSGGVRASGWGALGITIIVCLVVGGAVVIISAIQTIGGPKAKVSYYEKHQQYNKAISQLDKVIGLEPKNARAYNERGIDHQELGQYQKAIDDYTKAIELNPRLALAYSNRGLVFIHLGQYKKAIDDCSESIKISPNGADAYSNRGIAYMGLKQYQKGIDDESMALQLLKQAPKPGVYINRGNAYCELKQYQKAIDDFSKAVALDPNSADYYANRGDAYQRMGQYKKAIADCSKAIELDSKSADTYQNRGQAYEKLGQHEAAKKDLAQAKRLGYKPDSENIQFSDIYH